MNLPTEVFGNVVVVHAPDELGYDQCEGFVDFVTGLPQARMVLDLDTTEQIDSAGLTSLLDVRDNRVAAGGTLKLAVINPNNRKIIELTRLDRQLEVFDSVLEAVKSFR
jgi:anti-anti-sigma factor